MYLLANTTYVCESIGLARCSWGEQILNPNFVLSPPPLVRAHVCFERSYLNGPYHSIVDHDLYNSIQVVAIDHSHDPALIEVDF